MSADLVRELTDVIDAMPERHSGSCELTHPGSHGSLARCDCSGALLDSDELAAALESFVQAKVDAAYQFGIERAEAVVREGIAKTSWAGDARIMRLAADRVHKLLA